MRILAFLFTLLFAAQAHAITVSSCSFNNPGASMVFVWKQDQTKCDVAAIGTGLSYDGTTIANSAPDQTVVLTAGSGIGITGTYPNFTISNTQSGAVWGNITGTLSDQTDLQNALDDLVPYTGATGAVDLGAYGITAGLGNVTQSGLGTTTADGYVLSNTTAAASLAQQVSPAVRWRGQGWKTQATAASQPVDFRAYVLPVQGVAQPSGTFLIESSINGGAYSTQLSLASAGTSTLTGSTSAALRGGGLTFAISNNGVGQTQITATNTLVTNTSLHLGSTTSPAARLQLTATTEQLRISYNPSNYYSTTVGSTGGVTFDAVGAGSAFAFSDPVTINGDFTVTGTCTGCGGGGNAISEDDSDVTVTDAGDGVITFTEDAAEVMRVTGGNVGIGTGATVSAKSHVIATSEQQRIGYDTSNYYTTTVSSTGAVTFDATGSGAGFTFAEGVTSNGNIRGASILANAGAAVGMNGRSAWRSSADGELEARNSANSADSNVSTKSVRGNAVTFANLPASPVEGMMVAVTDSTTDVWGATITGGGALHVGAYFNGSSWTVYAK